MTDTTDLGTIYSFGQRRAPGGTFPPPAGGGGGGGPPDIIGVEPEEVELNPEPPPTHPCDDPETALPWNTDAAAAAAVAAFRQAAAALGGADAPNGSPVLTNREFGRAFGVNANGAVYGNTVHWGDPPNPAAPNDPVHMTINFVGVPPSEYVGFAHTHIDGNGQVSERDWTTFTSTNNFVRSDTGRSDQTFYLYIIAVGQNGQPDKIYVYADGPRSATDPNPPQPTAMGPEVNPDAQPCP